LSRCIGLPLATVAEVPPADPINVGRGSEVNRHFGPALDRDGRDQLANAMDGRRGKNCD
jgi:hypothetical protein